MSHTAWIASISLSNRARKKERLKEESSRRERQEKQHERSFMTFIFLKSFESSLSVSLSLCLSASISLSFSLENGGGGGNAGRMRMKCSADYPFYPRCERPEVLQALPSHSASLFPEQTLQSQANLVPTECGTSTHAAPFRLTLTFLVLFFIIPINPRERKRERERERERCVNDLHNIQTSHTHTWSF